MCIDNQNPAHMGDYSQPEQKHAGTTAGSQKDRHPGTSGAKEGFSSIGRFSKK